MTIREPAATGSQVPCGPRLCLYATACAVIILSSLALAMPIRAQESEDEEVAVALSLAKMLQAGRQVISSNQELFNDPDRGDKGLTGDAVLAAAADITAETDAIEAAADVRARLDEA